MNVSTQTPTKNVVLGAFRSMFIPEKRSVPIQDLLSSYFGFGGLVSTEAGKKVNTNTALKLSAFFCGVNVISNALAILPIEVIQKNGDSLEKLTSHRLNKLLQEEPNSYMSSFTLRKITIISALLKGDGYTRIIRNPATGREERLQFLEYSDVTPKYNETTDVMSYEWKNVLLSSEDVIHIKGFTQDGKTGRSIIQYAADNLGISLGAMEFGANNFNNKGLAKGVIESDHQNITVAKKQELAQGFSNAMSTSDPYRVAVLDEGMKYKTITLSNADVQFIETYASGIGDIARWLNIPPHKLNDLTNANYSNIYQMELGFLGNCVMPWAVSMEAEYKRKLLTTSEKNAGQYINLDEESLLRPDLKTKGEYVRAMVLSGVFTPNEGRRLVGRNPMEGEQNDQLLQPVNLFNQEQLEKQNQDG